MIQPGYIPNVLADSLEVFIGMPATGRATASSTTLDLVQFTQLPGQAVRSTFTPDDVGCPIAIIGGGPTNPLMPPTWFVQGAMFHTTIAAYVSPTEVILADAPVTSIYNSGFCTVVCYRRAFFQMDSFKYSRSIAPGTRQTMAFTVLQNDPYIQRFEVIARGQPVYMRSTDANNPVEFGGSINTLDILNQPGLTDIFAWQCGCIDWKSISFRRIVPPFNPKTYANMPGDEVFGRLVCEDLIDEGISVDATPADNITLGAPIGAYLNTLLDQVVQKLSTPTQPWYWDVDPWRKHVLHPRTATLAPWDVNDGYDLFAGDQPVQVVNSTTGDQLANFVYGIGQNVLFNSLAVTILGDGSSATFNVPQPFAAQPTILLNGVTSQTVGIQGVDTGKQWYWNQGSPTLTQDSGGTPLAVGSFLVVTYQFTNPGVAQSPNSASLSERASIEATSGQYDYSFSVAQPILPADLLAACAAYQQQYGGQPQAVRLATLKPGLDVGQLQTINYGPAGVSGQFLIATVDLTIQDQVLRWDYSAFRGANVGLGITGLVQFINRGGNTLSLLNQVQVIASDYANSRPITIDHTQVPSDQVRFPLCVRGTFPWLKSAANGGNVQNPNGYDIIFSSTPDGANPIPFERVAYDGTTGAVQFWVMVANLSAAADTVIYICWNNANVTTDQQHPDEVWAPLGVLAAQPNSNYHGVYHLEEAAAPYKDTSGYNNDSTGSMVSGYPTQVAGVIGKGQRFNGSQGIQMPGTLMNNGTANTSATFAAWVKTTMTTDGAVMESMGGAGNHGLSLGVAGASQGGKAYLVRDDGGASSFVLSNAAVNDGQWHHLVGTVGGTVGSNDSRLYVDGVLQGSPGAGLTVGFQNTIPTGLGQATRAAVQPYGVDGDVDEARALQWPLSADWIACEYANQRPSSTFYVIGNQSGGQTTAVTTNNKGTVTNTAGDLTTNQPMFGNGGVDAKVGSKTGTTNKLVSATGGAVNGAPLLYDSSGNASSGDPAELLPTGGTAGQVLTKNSSTNWDVGWANASQNPVYVDATMIQNSVYVNGTLAWQGSTDFTINGVFV